MMNAKHIASTLVTIAAAAAMFACVAPTVNAADTGTAVVSSRSFPKVTTVKKNILAESTATSTDDNSSWGDVESLDVPQTQSQAEKDAAARKAAEEQAAAQAQASRTQAASRSAQRAAIPQVDLGSATGSGADVARFASQFSGYPYVCMAATLPLVGIAPALCSTYTRNSASPCRTPPAHKPVWALLSVVSHKRSRAISLPMALMQLSISAMVWS